MSNEHESYDHYDYLNYVIGDPIAQSDHKTEGHQISKSSKLGLLIVGLIWVAVIVICAVTGITR